MADKTEKKEKGFKGFIANVKNFFGRIAKFFRDTASEMIVLDAVFGLVLNLLLRGA